MPHNYVQNNPKISPKHWMLDWTDGRTFLREGICELIPLIGWTDGRPF